MGIHRVLEYVNILCGHLLGFTASERQMALCHDGENLAWRRDMVVSMKAVTFYIVVDAAVTLSKNEYEAVE
jgi:hypothetical protein